MEELRKMIDGQKKPHFVQGQTESGSAKKPGRIAEDVFRLSPHHLTCWMQIASVQFTKIASELGSGGGCELLRNIQARKKLLHLVMGKLPLKPSLKIGNSHTNYHCNSL